MMFAGSFKLRSGMKPYIAMKIVIGSDGLATSRALLL